MSKKRILIVDDSFIMRKLVTELIESDPDLEVADSAEDGRVALQKVRECNPDLILLDIEMPEMSGLETLRRLGLRSKSKVVILSSVGQKGSPESTEALRLGAAAVLDKPSGSISLDLKARRGSEIVRTVRDVLGLPPDPEVTPLVAPDAKPDNSAVAEPAGAVAAHLAFRDVLLTSLSEGVLLFEQSGKLALANPAAARLLGAPDLVTIHPTLEDLFTDYNEGMGADLREALASGQAYGPDMTEFGLPDGGWQPIRLSAQPVPLADHSQGLLVLLEDMRREQEVRKILARTLSNDVATKLLEGGGLNLGGAMERASILFSDVRSFTTLSEEMGAAGIVELLNEYFSFMEDILKASGGVIDKYIGDAIMALFGVPVKLGDDADRAVTAGLRMIAALDVLNQQRAGQGRSAIKIGIGISTGDVIAGNIGSATRMNYTVIGDAVNLAARIESLTKSYGADLMICGETKAALTNPPPMRKVDLVRVKGQSAATVLYQVFPPEIPPDPAWLAAYSAGFEAYLTADWVQARANLERALTLRSDDKAAKMLVERCAHLAELPADGWDGVWTHQEK